MGESEGAEKELKGPTPCTPHPELHVVIGSMHYGAPYTSRFTRRRAASIFAPYLHYGLFVI